VRRISGYDDLQCSIFQPRKGLSPAARQLNLCACRDGLIWVPSFAPVCSAYRSRRWFAPGLSRRSQHGYTTFGWSRSNWI